MNCKLCNEDNIEADHETSAKHLQNEKLKTYSRLLKQRHKKRKGLSVFCNVQSSSSFVANCALENVQISAKPNEQVTFKFLLRNEGAEDLSIVFVGMSYPEHSFTVNNHGLVAENKPHVMKAKSSLNIVSVNFSCEDIGQYKTPIFFQYRKSRSITTDHIVRQMIVFVEGEKVVHSKLESPFAQKDIKADKMVKCTIPNNSDDIYFVPKTYKSIFSHNLTNKKDASKQEQQVCEDIKDIFSIGFTEENYIRFFHNLLWYEETITRVNMKNYNMSGVMLNYVGHCYELKVPGLAEKRPSLMTGDKLYVKPQNCKEIIFEAVITNILETTTQIRGFDKQFKKYYTKTAKFDVRFSINRLPLERMHVAINSVTKSSPDRGRVFPLADIKKTKYKPIKNYYNPLVEENPEQRRAVEHILAGTMGTAPYLVHGPPGTGKTVTIVEAILQLVAKDPANRILVCTDSNMAADHVASILVKYAHMFSDKLLLRANSQHRCWGPLPTVLHEYSNGTNSFDFERVSIREFKSYNIVVTTLSHAAKHGRELRLSNMERHITHLFIDEAAQASEPMTMIPVTGLLKPSGSLVLAGDPLQLGPVIISHEARRLGLGLSLMERLKNTCPLYSDEQKNIHYTVMLRNNFRSDANILKLPNELFYGGQLRPFAKEDPISSIDILSGKPGSHAIEFHGVLSQEERLGRSPSFYNTMELQIIQKYIKALVNEHKVLLDDIGVVTPYIRQVYKVKEWLGKEGYGKRIEVGTVEAFQGKEKRVIIISTVRANCNFISFDAKYQLGFLVDDKRFNVALTRAKAKAIVIGNPVLLEKDVKWRKYIDTCRELGTYHGCSVLRSDEVVDKITPLINQLTLGV